MSHVKSYSVEQDGQHYLYGGPDDELLGGPYATEDEATSRSKEASRVLGEQPIDNYKQFFESRNVETFGGGSLTLPELPEHTQLTIPGSKHKDNFINEWSDHYPTRKSYYSEAANHLRANTEKPAEEVIDDTDLLIPQSNLWLRSQPGHDDIPSMPDPRNQKPVRDEDKASVLEQFIKDHIYPQLDVDQDLSEHVKQILADLLQASLTNPAGPAIVGGIRDLGQGLIDVASDADIALGGAGFDFELPQIDSADQTSVHLVRGLTQFFAGFGAAGGLAKGAGLLRQTLAGGAADATFDPELGNLSTMLREQFNTDNELVNFLDAKVGEDADALERLESRAKMVLEGAGIGALVPTLMGSFRAIKDAGPEAIDTLKRAGQLEVAPSGSLPTFPGGEGQRGMLGYHGTPHKWESGVPDLSKVGTGEGAQAYGHGIYFAENPNVAKTYQGKVSAMSGTGKPQVNGRDINWDDPIETAAFEMARHNGDRKAAAEFYERTFIESDVPDILRSDQKLPKVEFPGNLYEVDIPDAEIDRMLDWDKPLSEQPEIVEALEKHAQETGDFSFTLDELPDNATGGYAYKYFSEVLGESGDTSNAEKASAYLSELGIPGIKYLDQGSRTIGAGASVNDTAKRILDAADGDYKKAVKIADERIATGNMAPDDPRSNVGAARKLLAEGRVDEGTRNFVIFDEELLNRINIFDGDGKSTHHSTGQARDSSGRFKKAE